MITVGAGHHTLTFTKEGFNNGAFPLDISQNDVSGGSVTFELGAAAYDTVELRDGSVLSGDLVSVSGMDVEVRIGGAIQHIDRNKVKRVLLVQREMPKPDPLPPANPPAAVLEIGYTLGDAPATLPDRIHTSFEKLA